MPRRRRRDLQNLAREFADHPETKKIISTVPDSHCRFRFLPRDLSLDVDFQDFVASTVTQFHDAIFGNTLIEEIMTLYFRPVFQTIINVDVFIHVCGVPKDLARICDQYLTVHKKYAF